MPTTYVPAGIAGRPTRPQRTFFTVLLVTVTAWLGSAAVAQAAPQPLAALLPGSTVAAVHLGNLGDHDPLREFWQEIIADADYGAIAPTVEKLVGLLDGELFGRHGARAGQPHDFKSQFHAELTADCPQLSDALEAFGSSRHKNGSWDGVWGSAVIAVTLPRHNPLPGGIAVVRPADAEGWDDAYQALVYCYASDAHIDQDGVALSVFADGSDQPLVGATVNGDFIFATTVDLARASVRLANGANEPNHRHSPIGLVAGDMMSDGVGITLDLGALAAGLQGLTGLLPGDDAAALVNKLLASLRTVRGVAANVSVDDAGLLLKSVVVVDDRHGESELAELLVPDRQRLAAPKLVPAGAVSLAVGRVSLPAAVAWIDSWLAAAAPLLPDDTDVRSLARTQLGLDLDSTLFDWLGDTWQVATLEVPGTDLVTYLKGQEGVLIVPVTSEAAAGAGLAGLAEALERLGDSSRADVGWNDAVAVTDVTYRGVAYQRWRVGPLTDFGVAVLDNQLIIANPATTMAAVIDVHYGADSVLADARLGGLVPPPSAGLVSYELVDLPRYLLSLAEISDLLAAPTATGLRAAARGALADGDLPGVSEAELPTFAELVGLSDFVTDLLRALAGKTGVMTGSSEVVGSALWSTYRLPLR